MQSRGGLVVLLSDLYDPSGFRAGLDRLRYDQFELHLVQLFTPEEAAPSTLGDVELVDAETGAARQVTIDREIREAYVKQFQSFLTSVRQYADRYGIGCLQSATDVPYDELILRMMRLSGTVQ